MISTVASRSLRAVGANSRRFVRPLGWTLAATVVSHTQTAMCQGGGDAGSDPMAQIWAMFDQAASSVGPQVQQAIDTGVPTQVSYGFVSGFCSGYALKKAGRVAAVAFGLCFMGLQSLSYMGYVKVDHGAMKKDIEKLLDLNKDGKVDQEDVKEGYAQIMDVIAFGVPAGGGFGAGFVGGLRSG